MDIKKVKLTVLEKNDSFKILLGKGQHQQVLPPHIANIDAFLLVQKGELLFNLKGKKQLLGQDNYIKIPKEEEHSLELVTEAEFLIILDAKTKMRFV